MAAQKGKDLLLKIDDPVSGTFVTVAGLRARTLAFNAEQVDITNQDSAGQWRELLEGTGVRSARITGAGIFKDQTSDELLRTAFFSGSLKNCQITIPDFGVVQGPFQIVSLEFSGRHDNELAFETSLESAGQISFTSI